MPSIASMPMLDRAAWDTTSDEEVVQRVRGGETGAYEILMRRHNQRLYRVARTILRKDAEAEDVMQEAYVRAYEHLNEFAGKAKFSTWLTKIAVHEALGRIRRRGRTDELESISEASLHTMAKVAETAACLDIGAETVKTRFHRARSFLRKEIHQRANLVAADVFPFHLSRCDRVVEAVFRRIGSSV